MLKSSAWWNHKLFRFLLMQNVLHISIFSVFGTFTHNKGNKQCIWTQNDKVNVFLRGMLCNGDIITRLQGFADEVHEVQFGSLKMHEKHSSLSFRKTKLRARERMTRPVYKFFCEYTKILQAFLCFRCIIMKPQFDAFECVNAQCIKGWKGVAC